jgi:hypothetical protein
MAYRWLTTLILGAHFAYLAYVVVGGFLAWRWPRAIWPHLAAAAWGVALVAGLPCPLTYAEDWSRRRAGEAGLTAGFIDRYVEGVLYPARYTGLIQALVAMVMLTSYVGAYARWRARRHRHASATARSQAPDTTGKGEDSSGGAATL